MKNMRFLIATMMRNMIARVGKVKLVHKLNQEEMYHILVLNQEHDKLKVIY